MTRIPEAEVARLKREVDLVALVEASGVQLTKRGTQLVGRCPMHHPDKTPSLHVDPRKGLWN